MPVVNYDDARAMYSGSYVEHEGQIYIVGEIGRDSSLHMKNLETGETTTVLADPEVVTAPLSHAVGYCQYTRGARFWKRKPNRTYKVGVCHNNTDGAMEVGEVWGNDGLRKVISNMFHKRYPTMKQALASAGMDTGRMKMVAFDRQWAVHSGGLLFYRGDQTVYSVNEALDIQSTASNRQVYLRKELEVLKGL